MQCVIHMLGGGPTPYPDATFTINGFSACGDDRCLNAVGDTRHETVMNARGIEWGEPDCTCYAVPAHLHTTHYGATDPATTLEPNPDCPVHQATIEPSPHPPTREQIAVALYPWIVGSAMNDAADAVLALIQNGADR